MKKNSFSEFILLPVFFSAIEIMASSSNSPCAACKFLRRKCTSECVFAPYFPPDQPQKFVYVHKIFGASNVSKLLNEIPEHQREDAVSSLAYEAAARIQDPVYGCTRTLSTLNTEVNRLRQELYLARRELARYVSAGMSMELGSTQGIGASSSLRRGMSISRQSPWQQLHPLEKEQQIIQELVKQERQDILTQQQWTKEQLMEMARWQGITASYGTAFTNVGFGSAGFIPPGISDEANSRNGHEP